MMDGADVFRMGLRSIEAAIDAIGVLEPPQLESTLAQHSPALQRTVIALSRLLPTASREAKPALLHTVGYAHYLLGNFISAERVVSAAVAAMQNPDADTYYLLALIRLHHEDGSHGAGALAALRATLQADPTHTAAYVELMDCLSEAGDMASCRALAKQAVLSSSGQAFWKPPWPSQWQRPAHCIEGLRAQPWWERDSIDFVASLNANYPAIKGELMALLHHAGGGGGSDCADGGVGRWDAVGSVQTSDFQDEQLVADGVSADF
eukprot:SAG11_NODE_119_length_15911_cov_7.077599_1_plen_264_part_00